MKINEIKTRLLNLFKTKPKSIVINKKNSISKTSSTIPIEIILVSLFSALLICCVVIALPFTEKYIKNISYNITFAQPEVRKSYELTQTEISKNDFILNLEIIENKLNKLGFHNIEINDLSEEMVEDKVTYKTKIFVQTNGDLALITRILNDKSNFELLLPKQDFSSVDPNDSQAQIQQYLLENYTSVGLDRSKLRNIQIQKLKNTSGDYSYFALLKSYPNETKNFNKFLTENNGKTIGINLSDYVRPFKIEGQQLNSLIISITSDETEAKYYKVFLNSGVIKGTPKIGEAQDETPITYVATTQNVSIFTALLILITCIGYYFKFGKSLKGTINLLLSYLLSIAVFIAYYKLTGTGLTLWSIPLTLISLSFIAYMANTYFTVTVVICVVAFGYINLGINHPVVMQILQLTGIYVVMQYLVEIYLSKLKTLLMK